MIRVGLVGAGMVSAFHLEAWARAPGAKVVAIADPDLARATRAAAAAPGAEVYPSAAAMLAAARLDAVDIVAPVASHVALCRLAADHGCAVCCQKPLAETAQAARELAAELGGRTPLAVHENWRHRPTYRQAQAWIAAGRIGAVTAAQLHVGSSGLLPDAQGRLPALLRQPFLAGMPRLIVFELLTHHFDALGFLLGALTLRGAALHRASDHVLGEDTAAILLQGAHGAPVTVTASFAEPGAPTHIRDRLTVFGALGRIEIDDAAVRLSGREDAFEQWPVAEAYQRAFDGAVAAFLAGMADPAAIARPLEDHIRALALAEAVYRTAERASEG